MIGTGVYTSLGLQAAGVHSVLALIFIWVTGGLVALCGALTYGELAARIPKSGGEYVFLSRIYHPSFGFLSGFISMTIVLLHLCYYCHRTWHLCRNLISVAPMIIAISVIVILTLLNSSSFRTGANFNFVATSINVLLILTLCIVGLIKVLMQDSH